MIQSNFNSKLNETCKKFDFNPTCVCRLYRVWETQSACVRVSVKKECAYVCVKKESKRETKNNRDLHL